MEIVYPMLLEQGLYLWKSQGHTTVASSCCSDQFANFLLIALRDNGIFLGRFYLSLFS